MYLLLYVGGLYTQIEYFRLAARGDSEIDAPKMIIDPAIQESLATQTEAPAFNIPILNSTGRVSSSVPSAAQAAHVSTVSRVVIPSIDVDSKVIEVGWRVEEQAGQPVAVWEVAEYAVGQHKGSANPGEAGNIVLAGHVGGYGKVFKDLFYVNPGDQIALYSEGQEFLYVVQEHLIVDEEGVSPKQRAANARLIEPTDHEVVTLVTCWPPKGPQRFHQRVVIQAVPYSSNTSSNTDIGLGAWTVR
ncbi:MAG: sortase [Chloroflexales bacterium]|nr:sortase [Chloroflexales bacterium]